MSEIQSHGVVEEEVKIDPSLTEEDLSTVGETVDDEKQKVEKNLEDAKEILWKNPTFLREATYLLISSEVNSVQQARELLDELAKDLLDKSSDKWEEPLEEIRNSHESSYNQWKSDRLKAQEDRFRENGDLDQETENIEQLSVVHCTDYLPKVVGNTVSIPTTYQATGGEKVRTSWHATLNHVVGEVATASGSSSWEGRKVVVISPFKDFTEANGSPFAMVPEDTFWGLGIESGVQLPQGTLILVDSSFSEEQVAALRQAGAEIKVVDNPTQSAQEEMKSKGIPVIKPENFKNPQRFAHEQHAFLGLHNGVGNDEDSGSYERAELLLNDKNMKDQSISELTQEYGGLNDPQDRYQVLVNLANLDYFHSNDVMTEVLPTRDRIGEDAFKDLISELRRPSAIEPYNILAHSVMTKLMDMASTQTKLSELSDGVLSKKLQAIKNNMQTIPPQLIGAFASSFGKHFH